MVYFLVFLYYLRMYTIKMRHTKSTFFTTVITNMFSVTHIQHIQAILPTEIKLRQSKNLYHEAQHSLPFSSQLKKAWSLTPRPTISSMVLYLHRSPDLRFLTGKLWVPPQQSMYESYTPSTYPCLEDRGVQLAANLTRRNKAITLPVDFIGVELYLAH